MQTAMPVTETERPTEWNRVNWRDANRRVRNLRQRIFQATQRQDWQTVRSLQRLMLRSHANTLVSVRRVTQLSHGKHTAGVDKVVVKTPAARGKLVDQLLTSQPWRARPARRVYIPKANGTLRPLGIPTVLDRCLQARVKNALEPAWEARFEGSSYGFRPGRSAQDAIARAYLHSRSNTLTKWVVDADIKGAFDSIDHAYLLKTIGDVPGRGLIKQWLKAGYMEDGVWHDTDAGTPQGGVISPLLANIALHGLEEALGMSTKWGQNQGPRAVVRYADDFIVFCRTHEDAERTIGLLTDWLAIRGLRLSEEKTRIVHLTEGFDFLGWNVRLYASNRRRGYTCFVTPSNASVTKIKQKLRAVWRQYQGANVAALLTAINPIVRGWANYYRTEVSSRTFKKLDHWMWQRSQRYAKRNHPNKPWYWRKRRYWGKLNPKRNDTWVFGDKASGRYLQKFAWVNIKRHTLVKGAASPDDPTLRGYWEGRMRVKTRDLPPSHQVVARRQQHVCPLCGETIHNGEEIHIHHVKGRGKPGSDRYENLIFLHLYCHQQITARESLRE